MSSWYAFGVMGIFPNAGQDVYLIGSPTIPELTLHLANGNIFVIEAKNVSVQNKYVIAATLDGQPLRRAWLRNEDILRGGRLVLMMADHPAEWATGVAPPSSSDRQ